MSQNQTVSNVLPIRADSTQTYTICQVPECGRTLGQESRDLDYRFCLDHRKCEKCSGELSPAEARWCHTKAMESLEPPVLIHPRCALLPEGAASGEVEKKLADPTVAVKQSLYDQLNLCRLMIYPDLDLSVSTNENNAMIYNGRLVADMTFDEVYLHQKMLEACLAQTSLVVNRLGRKELKAASEAREVKASKRAKEEARTSSRPVGVSPLADNEQEIALFQENFGIKSRKRALHLRKLRDKAAEGLAKMLPSAMAYSMADAQLKDNIAKGLVSVEDEN